MVGHLQVPDLTGNEPASVNRAAVQLLRTGVGYNGPAFDGPVFSDDLSSMAAIKDHYTVPDAVLRALQAGNDVALWITTDEVPAVLDRLQKALDARELTMSERRRTRSCGSRSSKDPSRTADGKSGGATPHCLL